ncbi:hypothetical protein [Pseudomonas svalbardensis]|uniref:hypothetical protein n=1 Tax=Pseudomonas svalbardensis TaxID=3042029 RepID=UPI0024B379F9|nr:hypothetical protein [Pseudomonas sp. PMCC200367]
MSNAQDIDLQPRNWNYMQGPLSSDDSLIERKDVLQTILDVFTPDNHVVFLESESGMGATTALAQFVAANMDNTFSVFLNPSSQYSYSLDYVRLIIAEQLKFFLDGKTFDKAAIDDAEFSTLLFRARSKFKGKIAYFVVDGLAHIPTDDESYVSAILNSALPIGVDNFRFLISGPQLRLAKCLNKVTSKTCQLRRFLDLEVDMLFEEFPLLPAELDDLKQLCRGNPGKLCAIKRQLKVGAILSDVLLSSPEKHLDFIALDFSKFDDLSISQKKAVSVLAFSKQLIGKKEVELIAGVSEPEISGMLESCTFLESKGLGLISFISSSHRKYAESKLKKFQLEAVGLQIQYLEREPESSESLLFLASYLQQQSRNAEIIELISNEHYYLLLESTQSLAQLKARASIGLVSAHAEESPLSIFQFALQKSLFVDLSESSASKAEVNALVAIGKTQHAMQLVERALTKISKLSLLTAYANGLKSKSKNVDSFLLDHIVQLIKNVDFSEGGGAALQIAEELVSVDVALASEALERCLSNVNDAKRKDLTFSRFSIVASMEQQELQGNSFEGRIKNKAVKEFTAAMTQFHKDDSSAEIISFFDASKIKNKTRVLIRFVSTQNKREGLLDIVKYVLGVIDKDTDYTVTLKDLASLASALRTSDGEPELALELVDLFDRQIKLIKDSPLAREFVRLNTYLAYAEARNNPRKAYDRLIEAYYVVSESNNCEVQSECFVRLFYALRYVDPDDQFESEEGFKAVIDQGLKTSVNDLLSNAASQYECIESVLPALIECDVSEAFNLAKRLNTLRSRFLALQLIAEDIVSKPHTEQAGKLFTDIITSIDDHDFVSNLLLSCTKMINKEAFDVDWAGSLRASIAQIKDYLIAARCKVNLFKQYAKSSIPMGSSYLVDAITVLIEKFPPGAIRNEVCFNAVEALSEVSMDEAERLYERATEFRGTLEFENIGVQQCFMQCLALTIRSFGVAIKNGALDSAMLARLAAAIGKLSSPRQQIALFTDLASRAWLADSMLKTIVSDFCYPLLERIRRSNETLYAAMYEIAFPALFVCHSESALKELSCLSESNKDSALYNACELIRRKQTATDPAAMDSSEEFSLDYNQATDIVTLIEYMECDASIYPALERLMRSVASKKNKAKFSSQQRRDISARLIDLIHSKLPDQKNITHKGYALCALARVYMITDIALPTWQALIEEAKLIPNAADKAFVYIEILSSMPVKLLTQKKELLEAAESGSNMIPWLVDKIGRLELCATTCKELNPFSAKKMLREAFVMCQEIEDIDVVAEAQRSLIDAADQIDQKFAEELLELIDDDPARVEARLHAKHTLSVVKAKKALANCNGTGAGKDIDEEFLSEAAWRNLSSLLSGRITAKPVSALTAYMSSDLEIGLGELYPLLCWYIENAARKYVSAGDVKQHILPMCEALMKTAELAIEVISTRTHLSAHVGGYDASVKGLIIKPNTRASALEYIQNWLNQNCLEYIKFCDPFFTSDDVEIVQMIQAANPSCKIQIIASSSYLREKKSASNDEFEVAWQKISDQTPPETYIYGVGKLNNSELIHDRWLISKGVGLRLGTSFNSIGYKVSEISIMTPHDLSECEVQLNRFLVDQVVIDGGRVKIERYQL